MYITESMAPIEFRETIRINAQNPYVLVNKQNSEDLKNGWKKPMPVIVHINGIPKKPWRINIMPKGEGSVYLYLNSTIRKSSGTNVGDEVSVHLSFNDKYRGGPANLMPSMVQLSTFKKHESTNSLECALSKPKKRDSSIIF